MSLGSGWIKLHRKILDNWIWDDPEKLRAWLDILLMVNHEDKQIAFNGHIITIHKGQKLTSLMKLADRWGWTRNRVDRFLRLLDEAGMVKANRTPNGTVLTVINWAFYQDTRDSDEATNGATTEATYEATVGAQTRMNKNYKNEKEVCVSAPTPTPTLEDVQSYCRERGFTHVDAEKFFNYYDSKNWTEGGQVIKWKQRLAYWEAKDIAKEDASPKKEHIDSDDIRDIVAGVMKRREAHDTGRNTATGD